MPQTERLSGTGGLSRAAELLRGGGLVSFPTETVYGLGADATNPKAVAGIFAAKGRPSFNPLIVHIPDLEAAEALGDFPELARQLAQTFWPGALTLVVPLKPSSGIDGIVTGDLDTIGLRCPAHPLAQALLAEVARPLAGPSANPSGRISPTQADHVLEGLDGRIDAVLDGGACEVGLESTIIGFDGDDPVLLRPGGIPQEAIEAALQGPLPTRLNPDAPMAPGQLSSHYAPNARVRLNVTDPGPDEVLLGFGPGVEAAINLSESGDMLEAAANLFDALRRMDQIADRETIAVSPIPETGLGRAINDRLRRAAAPRD